MRDLVRSNFGWWLPLVACGALGCATPRAGASTSVAIVLAEDQVEIGRVEAWSFAGAIHGVARLDGREVQWRVRVGADGQLDGERWSSARRRDSLGLAQLQSARLALDQLPDTDLTEPGCARSEQTALARLALDLAARAWSGEGRARLPAVGQFAPDGCSE